MASNFLEILNRLHDADAEFVIVGGVAAALHGGSRVTFDLDIVPRLEDASWQALVQLLWDMDARPRIPEPLDRIRDVKNVREWMRDKGMLALNFKSAGGETEVDLLVGESDRFEDIRRRAVGVTIGERTFYVASIGDLIDMKRRAGRQQDLLDITQLEDIRRRLEE